ncbi:permease prefix domain 1-containing protein [Nocardia thailandica]
MDTDLEQQIGLWRGYVARRGAIAAADVDEMEDHLRSQVGDLESAGLSADEAFLVAVKRMGSVDALSREFAREHSDRLWKQLVLVADEAGDGDDRIGELLVASGFAVAAGAALKAGVELLGEDRLPVNLSLLVLPFLAGFFAWKRRLAPPALGVLAAAFAVLAVLVNVYPFARGGDTEILVAVHAPIVAWFAVGLAYAGGDWRSDRRRMDFVRFTGEWVVYLTLLALGGGVLTGLTVGVFGAVGVDVEWFVQGWVLPFGVAGAMVVAAWLVEAKQNVVENIAPVLTRVFTPLTVLMLVALLVAFATTRSVIDVDRDLLILMDLVLVLVLGLLLYALSARPPHGAPDLFDRLQLVLVVAALAVDVVTLSAMAGRIAEFGVSANKAVALGLNLVLLVNLAWSARLGLAFVRGRVGFAALERWQTGYVPVYPAFAAAVVVAIPPLFGFV